MASRESTLAHVGMVARFAILLLGVWLVASTFVLAPPGPVGFNMLVTGFLIVMCAGCALWAPGFRFGTAGLAVWLLATELLAFDDPTATRIINVAVGLALLAFSLVPSPPKLVDPTRPAVHDGFLD
jgi:hypothetical protein